MPAAAVIDRKADTPGLELSRLSYSPFKHGSLKIASPIRHAGGAGHHGYSNEAQRLIVAAAVVAVFYLSYRALDFTFNFSTPYAVCISIALYLGELYTGVLMLLFLLQVWRPSELPEQPVLPDRSVDVFVPTYNEDVPMLRITLRACVAMDYPHKTYVLDDGRRPAVEELARELGVGYLTRPDSKHAKAGNMNNALKLTDGEFIVILDADHVPDANFITRLLGYFADELMAFVQTPHAFYNFDSFQARYNSRKETYWDEGQLFYDVVQTGRNRWNAAIFAGSATMFRRKALEEIGGFAFETITEDLHTGLRLHARGWKSHAVSDRLIAGQAAPDVTTFHSQRLRWGEGNLSIFAYDNPLWTPGLTPAQRLCYLGSMIHWAGGPFLLMIYATPVLMLLTGVPPVGMFTWNLLLLIIVYMTLNYVSFRASCGRLGSFWNSQLFGMTSVWTSTRSLFRALFWRRFQKFVVTSKRGRQSKRVLPFIWPQAVLFIASVLALAWGWYLPASEVSDDYYKPMVATVWVVFHMCVAGVVIYRSLWPESRRFGYRHVVSLPVQFEKDDIVGYGVAVDLNDAGVGILSYHRLQQGDRLHIRLFGGGLRVECLAEVCWQQERDSLTRVRTNGLRAFRCGLRFLDLTAEQVDTLNEMCWHYAVPRRYWQFANGRSAEPRRLPVFLRTEGRQLQAVSDEVTSNGFTVLLDEAMHEGAKSEFTMPTPGGEVSGRAVAIASQTQVLAARPYQFTRFDFESIDGHGRETVESLVNPATRRRLQPLLAAYAPSRPVPVGRALLAAAVLLVLLLPLEYVGFERFFQDEIFLYNIAHQTLPLSGSERDRLMNIYSATLEHRYPSTDRLVLLESALLQQHLSREACSVTLVLAKRDTSNLDLQLAYAQALDDTGQPASALHEYEVLLKRLESKSTSAGRLAEVRLAAARAAVHADKLDVAESLFLSVMSNDDTENVRNELAGVLLSAGRAKDCLRLYVDQTPDFEGRTIMAQAYLHNHANATAEQVLKELVKARPSEMTTQLLLLRAQVMQNKFMEANDLVNRLFLEYPDSETVRIEMGQLALALARYAQALQVYQGLLEDTPPPEKTDAEKVRYGFIDAAASVADAALISPMLVARVEEALVKQQSVPTGYLGRLAWVLERTGAPGRAADLLRGELVADPGSSELRERYVQDLQKAGRWKEAEAYLKTLPPGIEVRTLFVELYLAQKDFETAESVCREILRINPFAVRGTLLLAQVMLARKDVKPAREVLQRAQQAIVISAKDRALLAGLLQWAGDSSAALAEYRSLLTVAFDQPALWSGYIGAAAAAAELTPQDKDLIRKIADKEMSTSRDPVALARLGWDLHKVKQPELSRQAVARALTLKPATLEARREIAGILGGVGLYAEALAFYGALPPDAADHRQLASLNEAANNFPGAAVQYRAILEKQPNDLTIRDRLAQVLIWSKNYPAAIEELKRLVQAKPANEEWKTQLAQIQQWSGDNAAALITYTELLAAEPDQPDLWSGFVDAAGVAPKLDPAQTAAVKAIGPLVAADLPDDNPTFLSRLAWLLVRVGESGQALKLIDRAVALKPPEPEIRKEIAGVLGAVGQYRRALQMLDGLSLTFEDRLKRIDLYNGDRNFPAAEAECRALLKLKPTQPGLELLLADDLSWEGKFDEAASLVRRLYRANPSAPDLELRLARVEMWGKNYGSAMRQFAALLEKNRASKEAQDGFLEAAAASSESLDPRSRALLKEIVDNVAAQPSDDPLYLGRLAQAWRRLNDPAKAVALLERAVALDPSSRPLRLQLAEALYSVGRYNEAETNFQLVLGKAKNGSR